MEVWAVAETAEVAATLKGGAPAQCSATSPAPTVSANLRHL